MLEKTYFNFHIGKLHFRLKDNYEYTDSNTGKPHMVKRFSIYTDGYYEYKYWLNFYTGWHKPCIVYSTCDYEDNRHNLDISLGWGNLFLYFPWKNKKVIEEDVNNPEPKYGFYLYGDKKLFDSFWYYVNKDGHSQVKCLYMPWSYDFFRKSYLLKDGWHDCLESERVKALKKGIGMKNFFNYPYEVHTDDERLVKKEFPFRYVTKEGEVQETTATCYMEEYEWRQKWLKWTSLFNKVRTSLEINFKEGLGNRESWKGWVTGIGCNVTKEEKENLDFETPLRRFEKEVNETHRLCV